MWSEDVLFMFEDQGRCTHVDDDLKEKPGMFGSSHLYFFTVTSIFDLGLRAVLLRMAE